MEGNGLVTYARLRMFACTLYGTADMTLELFNDLTPACRPPIRNADGLISFSEFVSAFSNWVGATPDE